MMAEAWSREEVEAAVAEYRYMLIQELSNQQYNKAEHNRLLRQKIGRSKSSIEFKHQNISAILHDADCFYIPGYKPLGNYQTLLLEVVTKRLLNDPLFDRAARTAVELPALAPIDVNFEHFIEQPPPRRAIREPPSSYTHQPAKRDYLVREASNRALGLAGEELVVAFERARLQRLGKDSLVQRVQHASIERGDGLGYDVLSFEASGQERFIEVKTTGFAKELPFYISRCELDFSSETGDQFYLYRLFEFRRAPRMFYLNGDMRSRLSLDPISFRASAV